MILLVLAAPVLGLRLGFSDESNFPEDTSTRQAYDLLVEGFGKGFNGPFLLVTEVGEGTDLEALAPVTEAVAADPEVVFVSPPVPNDPENPTAVLWNVVPSSGPQDEATTDLVHRLRDDILPAVEDDHRHRGAGHRVDRRSTWTSPTTWRRACRTSSVPCWCCRSCS